ncbi:MAG: delta-60 repeat domain-containing protein, partial [Bdellovibrionota bacterium]
SGFAANGGNGDDFVVTRLNTDGSTDASFGGGSMYTHFGFGNDHANAMVIQSDGKLLVAGMARVAGATDNFGIIRLDGTGILDATFGAGGKQTIGSTTSAAAAAVQADGKIILAGQEGNVRVAATRLNSDGSLDTGFGGTGVVYFNGSAHPILLGTAIAIQSDGKIIVGGLDTDNATVANVALIRLNSDGSLDTSFNGTGRVTTNVSGISCEQVKDISIQADGKIIVLGDDDGCGLADGMFMIRYNSDGTIDATFGIFGTQTFGGDGIYSLANSLAVQPDGKFVIGGQYLFNASAQSGFYRFK